MARPKESAWAFSIRAGELVGGGGAAIDRERERSGLQPPKLLLLHAD